MNPTVSPETPGDPPGDRAERLFVGAVWLAMSAALVAYVARYGRNVPYQEDWELLPVLTGNRPFGVSWLLEQMVEHRYILAKALLYPIWLASGDFRTPMYLYAALLVALSLAFVLAARRLRGGRASLADAFFPVALLHWAHSENIIFFSQLYYVLPVVLFSAAVLLIATGRWETRAGAAALGLCVLLLPLNGGPGMLYAPPLVVWSAYAARVRRRNAALLLATAATALAISALYFVGYRAPHQLELYPRTLRGVVCTTLEVLSIALGAPGGYTWTVGGIAVALAGGAAASALAVVAWRRPAERARASGMFACMAAVGLLVLGIGYGRAVLGPLAGLPGRYSLLVVPALCCVFLACVLYGGPLAGRLGQATLLACALALLGSNVEYGVVYAGLRTPAADAFLSDVAVGRPPNVIAQHLWPQLYPHRDTMAERTEMMRAARVGPYKGAPAGAGVPDGPYREVRVPVTVVASNQVSFDGEVARGLGSDPYVVYALPGPAYVCGVRLEFAVATEDGTPAATQVFWRLSGRDDFAAAARNCELDAAPGPGPRSETVWVYDAIDQVRVDPDVRPCELRLSGIVLLVPE